MHVTPGGNTGRWAARVGACVERYVPRRVVTWAVGGRGSTGWVGTVAPVVEVGGRGLQGGHSGAHTEQRGEVAS